MRIKPTTVLVLGILLSSLAVVHFSFESGRAPTLEFKFGTGSTNKSDQQGNYTFYGFGIALFLYLQYAGKKDREIYETELRISNKLHEEVQFQLISAIDYIESHTKQVDPNGFLRNKLITTKNTIHEILIENGFVDTGKGYDYYLQQDIDSFTSPNRIMIAQGIDKVNWKRLSEAKKITLYRVVWELLVNMKKHSDCTKAIMIVSPTWRQLKIEYRDNGSHKAQPQKQGTGLRLMEQRLRRVGGRMRHSTNLEEGFNLTFYIPIFGFKI